MISLVKLKILIALQKLPKNERDLGKLIVAKGFLKVVQSPINRPFWSHCVLPTSMQLSSSQCLKIKSNFTFIKSEEGK